MHTTSSTTAPRKHGRVVLTEKLLAEWLAEFRYRSTRSGVGLRPLPRHVGDPLLDYLTAKIAELGTLQQAEANCGHPSPNPAK